MSSVEAWRLYDGASTITSDTDVDALIDAMLADTGDNSVASLTVPDRPRLPSGIPGHELRVAVWPDDKTGGVQFGGTVDGQSGTWYVPGEVSNRDPLDYFYMGHDEEWPADSVVPVDAVRAAVKAFLASGGERPTGAEWKPWTL